MSTDERRKVHYRSPYSPDWTADTGHLAAVADKVRDDIRRLGVTYLVVDSYSIATSDGDTMGGEAAAKEYFTALTRIGVGSLTIAHVRGDSERFPDKPFGSVAIHNRARETWAGECTADNYDDRNSQDGSYLPHIISLELRNKKANERAKAPPQFFTFSFYGDGTIQVNTDRPGGTSVANLIAEALADGPMTIAKIAAAIKEDTGRATSEDFIRLAIKRQPQRFVQVSTGRPRTWGVQ
jgi:hypothetical protein